jgi:hypothetical protein
MRCPRDRSHQHPPSTNELYEPHRGFVVGTKVGTNKRPCVNVIKTRDTHLNPSCHLTGITTVTYPTQECDYVVKGSSFPPRGRFQQNDSNKYSKKQTQPRRVSTQWVRTIHSLTPVRGSTRPSIPPSFHRLEEVPPKENPKVDETIDTKESIITPRHQSSHHDTTLNTQSNNQQAPKIRR